MTEKLREIGTDVQVGKGREGWVRVDCLFGKISLVQGMLPTCAWIENQNIYIFMQIFA